MKKSDLFFLAANIYLAAVLSGTFGAWCAGIFWTLCMLFYMWKEIKDE